MLLAFMPSGLKMEFEITPSQVESLALPMHSPTALYITLLYWNAVLNLAVAGFDITALITSSRLNCC